MIYVGVLEDDPKLTYFCSSLDCQYWRMTFQRTMPGKYRWKESIQNYHLASKIKILNNLCDKLHVSFIKMKKIDNIFDIEYNVNIYYIN